jgi:hypothetical protein
MQPVRFRSLAVALLVGVGASASVVGSASAVNLPTKTVTAQGLRVRMPGADTEMLISAEATRVGIGVVAFGRQPRSRPFARITVTRTAPGKNSIEKVIVRKRLRKGELRFPITGGPGFGYRIRLQIGKRRWTTRLRTSNEVTTAVPSPTSADCRPSGTLEAENPEVAAGGQVTLRVVNTGKSVLVFGSVVGWSQLFDGAWIPVPNPLPGGDDPSGPWQASYTVAPGRTATSGSLVGPSMVPGSYRLTLPVSCASKTPDGGVRFDATTLATAPITVITAAGV